MEITTDQHVETMKEVAITAKAAIYNQLFEFAKKELSIGSEWEPDGKTIYIRFKKRHDSENT